MATAEELAAIADAQAAKPEQMAADGVSVTNRGLAELNDHIDRVNQRAAYRNGRSPFQMQKTRPPGAT